MLVLSRNKNQEILIGDNIVLTVIEIRGDKVRLGVTAPRHVAVVRSEIISEQARDEIYRKSEE